MAGGETSLGSCFDDYEILNEMCIRDRVSTRGVGYEDTRHDGETPSERDDNPATTLAFTLIQSHTSARCV